MTKYGKNAARRKTSSDVNIIYNIHTEDFRHLKNSKISILEIMITPEIALWRGAFSPHFVIVL